MGIQVLLDNPVVGAGTNRPAILFIVPRDSVESFRQTAHHLPWNQSVDLLFSGPWPPYNFVDAWVGTQGVLENLASWRLHAAQSGDS